MPANYVLLERIELNASAASVVFNNIPQSGYTDLKVVYSIRTDRAGQNNDALFMKINGNMTSLSTRLLEGDGSSAASYSTSSTTTKSGLADGASATASTFANGEIYIPNYTGNTNKSYSVDAVTENNATSAISLLGAGLWSSTAAITSLDFVPGYGTNFVQYSTFSLYGLAALGTTPVIAPKASGGNVIETDGTYWYHAFLTTGEFVPQSGLSCDVLVAAGGGGGGSTRSTYGGSGGAGAGGVLGFNSQSLAATSYTVTIGAGGAGGPSGGGDGFNGSNSTFGALTASVGGGAGGGATNIYSGPGANGGSGGGGESSPTSGGTATSGQGFNGGAGKGATNYVGGGGGGAGSAGSAGSVSSAGAGGAGVNTYTNATWLGTALSLTGLGVSGYIAGGGGGGGYSPAAGGTASAGGGAGATNGGANASNGTVNTGGGGGGATGTGSLLGGAGGSGIVIIRYAV
jgi:hypothetical protein